MGRELLKWRGRKELIDQDDGDQSPHPESDEYPAGLAPDMERYLRRGLPEPNTVIHEVEMGEAVKVDEKPAKAVNKL